MNNFMETVNLLEQRASGVIAWLTSQSSQINQMQAQIAKASADSQDLFLQIGALKQEMSQKKGS